MREDIAEFLRMQSYEVDEVQSGAEAIQRLNHAQYDMVLCDIKMPQMNGYDLLQHVRSENRNSDIPFIFLSALDTRDDKIRAHQTGCDGFLTKPIDFSVLDATLKSHVARCKARARIHEMEIHAKQRHMIAAIDDALGGAVAKASSGIQHLRETLPMLTPSALDHSLTEIQKHVSNHANALYSFQRALEIRMKNLELECSTILVDDLIQEAMEECLYHYPQSPLRYKAPPASATIVQGDAAKLQRAIGGLLGMVPHPFTSNEIVVSSCENDVWTLCVCDHPSMAVNADFFAIHESTDLAALSHVTRQRLVALTYALQVAQLHGGRLEIKIWPEDFLAVRMVIPQAKAMSAAA